MPELVVIETTMVWQDTSAEGQIRFRSVEDNEDRKMKPEVQHLMMALVTTMCYRVSSPI